MSVKGPVTEILAYLAVKIEQIESKDADSNLDVFDLDVLALAPAQLLEGHKLASTLVYGNGLGVEYE